MTASILTNTSAMTALQTLRNTNSNLQEVNNQISTGKEISSAKDNASLFAISEVMESDVAGFKTIEGSLSLGQATLGVASSAAQEVGGLLEDIKQKLISSREDNVDRNKLSEEIASLTDQVNTVVSSAQFNGRNLLDNAGSDFTVLASLDRDAAGNVTPNSITVAAADTDLSQTAATTVAAFDADNSDNGGSFTTGTDADAGPAAVADFVTEVADAGTADVALDSENTPLSDGDTITLTVNGETFRATADMTNGDETDVLSVLMDQINNSGQDISAAITESDNGGGSQDDDVLTITNNTGGAINIEGSARSAGGAGGLDGLGDGTVGSGLAAAAAGPSGATDADLASIETMIQNTVDVQAAIGTAQTRVESQSSFMSNLIDSFETGIGSLVDADMEEASARLQALQVQQQLGTQALSIANQQPQNLLALFR